jgi:hypothetical protein
LRHLGVQNAKRDSKYKGSDRNYASGHHGNPLDFLGHAPSVAEGLNGRL